MPNCCRLCTTNDREGLVEQLAAQMWDSRRDREMNDPTWINCGPYWQDVFRAFATTTIGLLERQHTLHFYA